MLFSVVLNTYKLKLTLNGRKPENSSFLRQKNIKEIIIYHKGTRMVKDGENYYGLQMTNLRHLGLLSQDVPTVA